MNCRKLLTSNSFFHSMFSTHMFSGVYPRVSEIFHCFKEFRTDVIVLGSLEALFSIQLFEFHKFLLHVFDWIWLYAWHVEHEQRSSSLTAFSWRMILNQIYSWIEKRICREIFCKYFLLRIGTNHIEDFISDIVGWILVLHVAIGCCNQITERFWAKGFKIAVILSSLKLWLCSLTHSLTVLQRQGREEEQRMGFINEK